MLKRVRKWEPEYQEALRKLYEGGASFAEIAAELNQQFGTEFTPSSVRSRVNTNGLRRAERDTVWKAERKAELVALVESGISYSAIAERMGTTKSSISGQVTKLGLNRSVEEALLHRSMRQAFKERRDEGDRYVKRMAQLLNWTPAKYRQEAPLPPFCEVVDDPLNLSMEEVGHGQCRWILNEDLTAPRFCGHSTTRKSWCARHAAVVLA